MDDETIMVNGKTPWPVDETVDVNGQRRWHTYHGEATILSGDLKHPLKQQIKPQTNVKLSHKGGYLSEHAEPYRLEGLISFDRAYTQTAGNRDHDKEGHGWNTLVTSVIEGLNVLEVVTADRVVGQIATHHPLEGYVPSVHFLGTRFENLRIAGHPVRVDMHPDPYFFGPKPDNDGGYTRHDGILSRIREQFDRIRSADGLPADLRARYNESPLQSDGLKESMECSLVSQVEAPAFGRSFGHVIDIPDFGKIYLALLRVEHSDYKGDVPKKTTFDLTMIKLALGCSAAGSGSLGNTVVGGGTEP
jgi:hypothetical protein